MNRPLIDRRFSKRNISAVIIAAIILAAIGYGAYRVGYSQPQQLASNSEQANTQPAASDNTAPPQSVQPAQQYLVIKEWGVKASYASNSDILTYHLSTNKNIALVGSQLLTSKYPDCRDGGAGMIQRFSPTDSAYIGSETTVEQDSEQHTGRYVFVNGYYYEFIHDQAQCGSASVADQNQANNLTKSALAKLQANQ